MNRKADALTLDIDHLSRNVFHWTTLADHKLCFEKIKGTQTTGPEILAVRYHSAITLACHTHLMVAPD